MCKIVKAETMGRDFHIACGEIDAKTGVAVIHEEAVYGIDAKFTMAEAVKALKSRHKAEEERKNPSITPTRGVVGTTI